MEGEPTMPKLSVVTSLFKSSDHLEDFYRRMTLEASRVTPHFELILVNDGSPDDSAEVALRLCESDARVVLVDLSRNFGQHKAIMTGLSYARGDLVFQIDADLEEDPQLLHTFVAELKRTQSDVVYGTQRERKGSLFKRLSGQLFYKVFETLSSYPVPSNPLNARLMTRQYVKCLLLHQEREVYMAGLWALTGFRQTGVEVVKRSRGTSSYTLAKKLSLTVNAITSFSNRPLYFIFWLGLILMAISTGAAVVLVTLRLFWCDYLTGWPSLILAVIVFGGLNIFCLGIVSIYLSKMFLEVKQRPYTIVRQVYHRSSTRSCLPDYSGMDISSQTRAG